MHLGTCLVCTMVLVGTSSGANYQLRDKPRSIRGFKNVALSTARGFGKRGSGLTVEDTSRYPGTSADTSRYPGTSADTSRYPGTSDSSPLTDRDSFPAEWLADELTSNPELARLIVRKFVDADQDGELTPQELLRPLGDNPVNRCSPPETSPRVRPHAYFRSRMPTDYGKRSHFMGDSSQLFRDSNPADWTADELQNFP